MTDEMNTPALAEQSPVVEQQDDFNAPTPPDPTPEPSEPTFRSPREALEKAFGEVDKDETPKDAPKEATTGEDGRARGPDGKFVAKDTAETPDDAKEPEKTEAVKAPVSEPPSRFSADAKAQWEKAPESVRGEINRAITELETGLQQKTQQLEPLKPFFDMAQQHGVTVHETLGRYINMEQALAANPRQGMELLARNFGKTLPDFLAEITGQEQQGQEGDKDRQILDLQQKVDSLTSQFGQINQTVQQQRQDGAVQTVQQFAAENPRFDELAPEIKRLLETGYATELSEAYDLAERLNPAPQPAVPTAPSQPAQPRVAKSVTGAPGAGSNPSSVAPSKSISESLSRAFGAAGLG